MIDYKRAIGGVILSLVFLMVFVYAISGINLIYSTSSVLDSVAVKDSVKNNSIAPMALDINSEAAISVKTNSSGDQIVYEKNSNEKLPIASLTKLMTAIVVSDNYDLSQKITVDQNANAQSALKQDVQLGQTLPVENFLEIMLIESSNRSAYALAELIGEQKFVDLMNEKAKEIGLKDTIFADPTGLNPQNVSTASDLVKLAKYVLKNYPRIADISKSKSFYVPGFGDVQNTDELLGEIPEIVCGKTGFTNEAKGCLLLVMYDSNNDGYFINVVLGADDRFSEMEKIINSLDLICK